MMYEDRIGQESKNNFGSLIRITGYRNYYDVDIYFPDYDWTFYNADYNSFKRGKVKCPYEPRVFNVGYLGEGEYKSRENNKQVNSYRIWYGMIRRCYDENHRYNYITYDDCYVCDEWLNYQNFAEWYNCNYYEISSGEQMHIDKDILIKGNRIYSPETCIFVPKSINNLVLARGRDRGDLPIGICYDSERNKYRAHCCDGHGKDITIGRYDTIYEAFIQYKIYKESVLKNTAEVYKEEIPIELYNALYNYTIDIND